MSKQKTLFQSWGGGQKPKPTPVQHDVSVEGNAAGEAINLCDSLEDGDDDLLLEAEFTTHEDDTENPTNISIGADGFTPTQGQTQNPNCPEFDMSTGKLWIYPTNYPVREYQFNIVKQSLFKNTMVTLPTGLGKTFIAAVVMYNFYRWYPQGKVIFMAPTKPLVAQQIEACYNIMGIPQDHTAEMTGSMGPPKREKAWHDKRVFFLTPQVLTNDLSRGSCPAKFVKCLVIDEAHKALGNHAYCQVVRELVKYTEQFRVLALSATPGSDIKAVQQVLSNLLISHIEIRTEDSVDIKQYSHERIVDKVVVPLGDELTKVKAKYIHIMDNIVAKLKRHGVLFNRDTTSLSKFLILKAREAFRQNPPEKLQRSQYGIVEGDFALAMSLYHGYELLQLHGSRSLYNYLEGILSGDKGYGRTKTELCKNGDFNELIEMLKQKYTVPDNMSLSQAQAKPFVIGHPKMEKLQDIVLEHFRKFEAKNATTRVMIFSQYRDSVQEITDMLNVHRPLVKVMSFIGQSSAGKSTKGFTQKEQLKVMKEFREGGYNTLVSTCVGEEGLDIGDVDLIICFDAHKSPIRLVQRMGRTGRKREGRIVMLVTQGKEEQIYNQSQYSKRSIHRAILNGAKSLHFYQHSPRMVPEALDPCVHKMYITINKNFKPTKKLTSDSKSEKSGSVSSHSNKDKKTDSSDGMISKEEYEELLPWLLDDDEIPKLPKSDFICLSKENEGQEDDGTVDSNLLSLSEWILWQNTLQETSNLMDHSKTSKHLVELMEFVQLQSEMNPDDDPYGLEMATYLNQEDVLPTTEENAPGSIARFCTMGPNEENTSNEDSRKTKNNRKGRVKSRHSDMLPEFEPDVDDKDQDSEDDFPMFPLLTKSSTKIVENTDLELPEFNGINSYTEGKDVPDKGHNTDENVNSKDTDSLSDIEIQRKIGKPKQLKLTKPSKEIKSKAKTLDIKMKSGLKTSKHKKIRNSMNNRSVLELLRKADDSDFDNTPPDKPEHLTFENDDSNSSVKVNDPHIDTDSQRYYVIRTPPTVEDAIRMCQAAELEVDRVKIDLLDLIDEWHRENENGKYILLPNNLMKNTSFESKTERKMSTAINSVNVSTYTTKLDTLQNQSGNELAGGETNEIDTGNQVMDIDFECNPPEGDVDFQSVNTLMECNSKDACSDIGLSGTFSPTKGQDIEQLEIDGVQNGLSPELEASCVSNQTVINELRTHSSHVKNSINEKSPTGLMISCSKTEKLSNSKSEFSRKIEAISSEWVSEDSDDELYEKIKTPSFDNKPTTGGSSIQNTNTQVTFTQALNCLNSGSMASESDSCKDIQNIHESSGEVEVNIESTGSNEQLAINSCNLLNSDKVEKNINSNDNYSNHNVSIDGNAEEDKTLRQEEPQRLESSSSDENEQPQFDLGFDIDEDIIPPSPELTQPFPVSGRSKLSQSFSSRVGQNRFPSRISCDEGIEEDATEPKSKRVLPLEDKITVQNLSTLVEEEESQSLLENENNNADELSPLFSQSIRKKASDTDTSAIRDMRTKQNEFSDDVFESSFALFDEELDNWIDDDLGQESINKDVDDIKKSQVDPVNEEESVIKIFTKMQNDYLDVTSNRDDNKKDSLPTDKQKFDTTFDRKKKKPFTQNRKSLFPINDLSFDDSFSDLDKQMTSLVNTPTLINRERDIAKATSTPGPLTNYEHVKLNSPAVTPFERKSMVDTAEDFTDNTFKEKEIPSDVEEDDSFIVRKKKIKPACLESPQSRAVFITRRDTSPDMSAGPSSDRKTSSNTNEGSNEWSGDDDFDDSLLLKNNDYFDIKNVKDSNQNDSDDDFDRLSLIKTKTAERKKDLNKGTSLKDKSEDRKRRSKPKRPSNPFIEEEADLSEDADTGASSDETDASDLDKYEGSFIHDSQFSQSQSLNETDIQALYIKSVRSPVAGRGAFKLQYDYKNIDVFSQMPQEGEGESQYMEDSFCVGSEDDDWLAQEDYHGEITMCNNKSAILQSGKKRRKGMSNLQTGRQREIHFGRMRALDEIRNKLAKKNRHTNATTNFQTKLIGIQENDTKKYLPKSRSNRIKIQSESSSEEDVRVIDLSESCLASPSMKVSKKRKRVKLLSSSDEDLQASKSVCSENIRYSGSKQWIVSENHSANLSGLSDKRINSDKKAKRSLQISSDDSDDAFSHKGINTRRSISENTSRGSIHDSNDRLNINSADLDERPSRMTKIKDRSSNSGVWVEEINKSNCDTQQLLRTAKTNDKSYVLVDSKELSGAQEIISTLRFKHKIHVSAASLECCDYIVSNRMAVERKQWSDFSNSANRIDLIERIQHLHELYERPCLIIEKDRVKDEKSEKPIHWTKYIDKTLVMLRKSQVKILFTDTQVDTADILADLCELEKRKNMNISVPVEICEKRLDILTFYTSIPSVTYVQALNLCYWFDRVSDLLKSSVSEVERKGKMSTKRATELFNFIHRKFDTSMLPTKYK